MEYLSIHPFSEKLSRIALGTWVMGGRLWGGSDDRDSEETIQLALDKGINVIDTAPAYGRGKAEEIVGKVLKNDKKREKVLIATKCGIAFDATGVPMRNLSRAFILDDLKNSLERLQTDYIDIYYLHWPDPLIPVEQTAEVMQELFMQGKIRSIGLSNHSPKQIEIFRGIAPCHFCQPPYNLFEREIEKELLKYCKTHKIALMTYGAICRGLLSGKMEQHPPFEKDDLRKEMDPKFQPPSYQEYLDAVKQLDHLAQKHYHRKVIELAIRWILDQGVEIAIWGARRPNQLDAIEGAMGWRISDETKNEIDSILKHTILHPHSPAFMAPPARKIHG